jgi:hypothetical protein
MELMIKRSNAIAEENAKHLHATLADHEDNVAELHRCGFVPSSF